MVDQSSKYGEFRQYISAFISGEAAEALINSFADESQRGEDLTVAVTDQLTISTASGSYLDKKLADKGISRPADLGLDDLSFRNLGIQVNSAKQITEIIHTILATFYGEDAVRAWTQCAIPAPYHLEDGMDLILEYEDGIKRTLVVTSTDFANISDAKAEEVADAITRFVRNQGLNGSAFAFVDPDTNLTYVRIYGSAKGPYSTVKILGGRLQNLLEFPTLRGTELAINNTVWEITKNYGDTVRFRWVGGTKPALDKVFVDDRVMIYGDQFGVDASPDLIGTWVVTGVRPPAYGTDPTAGWFEISVPNLLGLTPSTPDVNPPTNTPTNTPPTYYSWTVAQGLYGDLKFFAVKKLAPYSQPRFALAFEPAKRLLKIYLPATTRIVKRNLAGGAHLHQLYDATDLNGSHSGVTVVNDRSVRYHQSGYDNFAVGGTLTFGVTTATIESVTRENSYTTVVCAAPHGVGSWVAGQTYATGEVVVRGTTPSIGYRSLADGNVGHDPDLSPTWWVAVDPAYPFLTTDIITVSVGQTFVDDQTNKFLGPYMVDPEALYTLTTQFCTSRASIRAGEQRSTIFVKGSLPNEPGQLLFDLGKDSQEGPVRYLASAMANGNASVAIQSISQSGTNVTVITTGLHGAIPGSQVAISSTMNFNGLWDVVSVPSPTTYTFQRTPAAFISETTGFSVTVLEGASSTLTLDPSYSFKFPHPIGSDITLISDGKAYETNVRGRDYPPYITGTAEARTYVESLIRQITALGIILEIVVVYPSDVGLGNAGGSASLTLPPTSDKVFVWGDDSIQ